MAYSQKEWEVVKAFFERGLSLAEIVAREEVAITDRSTISRRAKLEGWTKTEKTTLLKNEIEAKQTLAEIEVEKQQQNATELGVHNTLVTESVRRLEWLNSMALQNVKEAMTVKCYDQKEFKDRADTILKGKETVFGKQPDTAIQINNNAPDAPKPAMTHEQLIEAARERGLPMRIFET